MSFQFQYKEYVWFFTAIAFFLLLFIFLVRWKKKITKRIGNEKLVKALINDYSSRLFSTKFIFLSLAFAFGVLAVMNPRLLSSQEKISRKGIDVVIALDLSKSMMAEDVQPNRLEKAKAFINTLLGKMPDDPTGLVFFAGKAYLQMPLTVDHDALKMYVSTANPDAMPSQGTMVNDALSMCNYAFSNTQQKFKTIILISDGEDHDEEGTAIKTAADLAQSGVMINTIGVGTPEGTTIKDPITGVNKIDAAGNTVVTKLNEQELKQIAESTNGIYLHLENTNEAINDLMKHLSQIEKKAFVDTASLDYKTFYFLAAAVMFLFLVIENFIPEIRKKTE